MQFCLTNHSFWNEGIDHPRSVRCYSGAFEISELPLVESISRNEFISFSCSTSIDKSTASIGSRRGATVHDEACCLALFIKLSNAALFSPLSALLNTDSSSIIPSSSMRKLGIVLPIEIIHQIQSIWSDRMV